MCGKEHQKSLSETPQMMFDATFFYTEALLHLVRPHVLRIGSIGCALAMFGAFKVDFGGFGHRSSGVRDRTLHTSTSFLS